LAPKTAAGRLPTVRANGSASLVIHRLAADEAVLANRAELVDRRAGADVGWDSTATWPPHVACGPKIVWSPTVESCATWT